jgi:phosphoribosylanthranilate isomerase
MNFLVKICGITSPEDAAAAVEAGAGAIGLNFWRGSPRFVEDQRAREILAAVPKQTLCVGVFVNAHPLVVTETLSELGLNMVQLHGDEKVGSWSEIDPRRIVRAIRVFDDASMKEALAWEPGFFIYDAHVQSFGGGGVQAPWPVIAHGARRPFLLAGGLSPENVAEGIRAVRPNGVDVASGVESAPGRKDRERLRSFVAAAREAAEAAGVLHTDDPSVPNLV